MKVLNIFCQLIVKSYLAAQVKCFDGIQTIRVSFLCQFNQSLVERFLNGSHPHHHDMFVFLRKNGLKDLMATSLKRNLIYFDFDCKYSLRCTTYVLVGEKKPWKLIFFTVLYQNFMRESWGFERIYKTGTFLHNKFHWNTNFSQCLV